MTIPKTADVFPLYSEAPTVKRRNDIMQTAGKAPEPFPDRSMELESLCRTYESVGVQRGHLVFVTGPSGVGKSALAHNFALEAKARGALVLESRCRSNDPPGGPLRSLLRQAAVLSESSASMAGPVDANRLLATLDRPGTHPVNIYETLLNAVGDLLEALASEAPVVVVVDDLQHADATSLDALTRLAGRLTPAEERLEPSRFQGVLLLTARKRQDLPGLWLEGLSHRLMPLGNLDEPAIAGLLSREDTVRRLVELTDGHPGRIRSLLAWGTADPDEAVAQVMASLSAAARDVLACCSVAAGPVGLSELAARTGLDAKSLGDTVQALLETGMVDYSLIEGELNIEVSERMLPSLLASLPKSTQRQWHLVWASAFRARGDMVRTAKHALAGQGVGDTLDSVLDDVLEAIRSLVSTGAVEQAADLSLAAVRRLGQQLDAHLDDGSVVALLFSALELLERQGRLEEAIESVIGIAGQADDPKLEWRIGRVLLLSGHPEDAKAVLLQAARSGALDRALRAAATVDLGECALAMGQADEARRFAAQAAEILEKLSSHPEIAASQKILSGKVLLATSEFAKADKILAQAVDIAHRATDREPLIRGLISRGIAALRSGDMESARSLYAQALERATRDKSARLEAYCQQNLGVLAHWSRDYKTALHWFHEAARTLSRIGNRAVAAWVAVDLGDLYLELGALDQATGMAGKAEELLENENAPVATLYHTILQARLYAEDGLVLKAKRLLMKAGHQAHTMNRRDDEAAAGIELARIELRLGDRGAALEALSNLPEPTGRKLKARWALTKGEAVLEDDHRQAERLFREALVAFQEAEDLDGAWKAMARLSQLAVLSGQVSQADRWRRSARRLEARIRKTVPEAYADSYLRASFRADYLDLVVPMKEANETARIVTQSPESKVVQRSALGRLVGSHPVFKRALSALQRIAATDSTVLLVGESGTGKELAAEAIHDLSNRRQQPLIKVNCAALVDTLLLSELFGHERGAFTGAVRQKKGRFEAADGGTLFLDEIGDISPRTQVALLRVLQEKTFERVGGVEPISVDVRIVCATNKNLEELVEQGLFREDLYYRLKGIQVTLPALRERMEDLPLLAADILERLAVEMGAPAKRLTREALEVLAHHSWPGNVRELQNVLRSSWVFSDGEAIDAKTVQSFLSKSRRQEGTLNDAQTTARATASSLETTGTDMHSAHLASTADPDHLYDMSYETVVAGGLSLKELKKSIERECISRALSQTKGNITKAAALLGMKRPRLSQLVKQYGLTESDADRSQMEENHD